MNSRRIRFATIAVCGTLVLGACSKSSTGATSPTVGGTVPAPVSTDTGGANPTGDFCTELVTEKAKLSQLGSTVGAAVASKDIATIKSTLGSYFTQVEQVMANVEASMASAPANVQAALQTVNTAFGQMQSAIANATSVQGLDASMVAFGRQPQLKAASKTLTSYTKSQCGNIASP